MVVTMSPDRVIKYFDVIEHVTPCLLAVGIDSSAYPLPLKQLEALNDGLCVFELTISQPILIFDQYFPKIARKITCHLFIDKSPNS